MPGNHQPRSKKKSGKRNATQILRDRELIARWSCRGFSQHAITDKLNERYAKSELEEERGIRLGRTTIERDLAVIKKDWKTLAAFSIDILRSEQLAELKELKLVHWNQWAKDKDIKHLENVLKVIERLCKMMGIDRPTKINITEPIDDQEKMDKVRELLNGSGFSLVEQGVNES